MGRSLTFIHAADLHLGAPFKGMRSATPEWASVLVEAIPNAYRRIVSLAIESRVDFVIFAGDIFDDSRPSYADFSLFVDGLRRLEDAGIAVYFVTGNHDPYALWRNDFAHIPRNATLIGATQPEFVCHMRDGEPLCLVGGRGYLTQSWPSDQDISSGVSREAAVHSLGVEAPFMVGILHTGLDIDPTRSPVSPRSLLKRSVDYWACGHIHQPRIIDDEKNPHVVYSGCPQGRDIKEEGEHGVFKVTLRQGEPNKVEFCPTAEVAWKSVDLDVSSCATVADIHEAIISSEFSHSAASCCQRMVFRYRLEGKTPLHASLLPHVLEDLRRSLNESYPFFYVDAITNATKPPINRALLRSQGLFPAVFMDEVKDRRADAVSTARMLEADFTECDVLALASFERSMAQLCDEAETLVLDLLSEEGQ